MKVFLFYLRSMFCAWPGDVASRHKLKTQQWKFWNSCQRKQCKKRSSDFEESLLTLFIIILITIIENIHLYFKKHLWNLEAIANICISIFHLPSSFLRWICFLYGLLVYPENTTAWKSLDILIDTKHVCKLSDWHVYCYKKTVVKHYDLENW